MVQDEPIKSCLLALRSMILAQDNDITAVWKYRMPFFCYKGKMCCYLWVDKKRQCPYLGIVEGDKIEHTDLIKEKRSRMKIMLFDANDDLPVQTIEYILKQVIALYQPEARS